jgi:peptidoglycan hydrolase CwlO-like protein
MSDANDVQSAEYVTQPELQQVQQATAERLSQLEQTLQQVEGQLEASRRENLNEMHRLLDERLERERRLRQSEIDDMRRSIDSRLGALETKMDSISGDLKTLTGRLSNWSQVIAAREKAFDEREARLENTQRELAGVVDTLRADQEKDRERLRKLGFAVLGDREGGRPSLYQLLEQTRDTVTARFDKQDARLTEALTTTKDNRERLETLEQSIERDRRKWERRRKQLWSVLSNLMENRWLMSLLAGLAVLVIVALVPDARDTALFLLEQIFNNGQ